MTKVRRHAFPLAHLYVPVSLRRFTLCLSFALCYATGGVCAEDLAALAALEPEEMDVEGGKGDDDEQDGDLDDASIMAQATRG